ncbi:MAG: helix-turn-helix domain-containing protein [Acidimicrobiia bacterium]|nr:helix-turn-helix domain-containing protein [Acidimicrobiia bacterium]
MKPSEVAEVLGCSTASVYRMIRSGELPIIRLGGRKSTRIVTGELRELLRLEQSTATA